MSDRETRAYYEAEAEQGLRTAPTSGLRVEVHEQFSKLLLREGRSSVIDFGAGPGHEGEAFRSARFRYVGLDLAVGKGVLAAGHGLHVIAADVVAPPIRPHSFDAGWSMSVLMHLPADRAGLAAHAMTETLAPGAPMWIGVWGGDGSVAYDATIEGHRRPYYGRSLQHNAELFGRAAIIEDVDLHELGAGEYQIFRLRAPDWLAHEHPPSR